MAQNRRPSDPFSLLAPFYDLDFGSFTEDLTIYREFAKRAGSPTLELGVGTGRLFIPLLEAGLDIYGIDSSEAMLRVAKHKITEKSIAGRLQKADMRDFHLPQTFALIFVALDGFMQLTTLEDQLSALHCIRRHLKEGGLLILDLSNPSAHGFDVEDRLLVLDWVRRDPQTKRTVSKTVSRRVDPARQLHSLILFYDEVDEEGRLSRTLAALDLHYYYPQEVQLLLRESAFELENIYGTYDLEPFSSESPRMIVVASKKG